MFEHRFRAAVTAQSTSKAYIKYSYVMCSYRMILMLLQLKIMKKYFYKVLFLYLVRI